MSENMRYLSNVPTTVPAGRIVVHNHVRPPGYPEIRLGFQGFRAWTEPAETPKRVRCECGWAPHLDEHYRVEK